MNVSIGTIWTLIHKHGLLLVFIYFSSMLNFEEKEKDSIPHEKKYMISQEGKDNLKK